jgi:hypothetical protein
MPPQYSPQQVLAPSYHAAPPVNYRPSGPTQSYHAAPPPQSLFHQQRRGGKPQMRQNTDSKPSQKRPLENAKGVWYKPSFSENPWRGLERETDRAGKSTSANKSEKPKGTQIVGSAHIVCL